MSRIRISSVGTVSPCPAEKRDTMALLKNAAARCLEASSHDRSDLGLLIYAGTYRSDFVSEPAIAALLAGEMEINASADTPDDKHTLAFDVFNGALGVLYACCVASQMIRTGKSSTAMIVAAEVENNAEVFPEAMLGIREAGSALLLDEAAGDGAGPGFGAFFFRSFPEHSGAFVSRCAHKEGKTYLLFAREPDLEQRYVACIGTTVAEFLRAEGLELSQIAVIFPPQISSPFIAELSKAMNGDREKFVDAVQGGRDLFSSSLPFAFQEARKRGLVRAGEIGLIISVGSGIQVGCALYHF